jgi:GT2 family glycosyltransferase
MKDTEPCARTAAIVVNWNGVSLLRRNLPTWLAQSVPFARILVVDNGSRDGSLELLELEPRVETLRLAANRGFAAAANRGIVAALEDGAIEFVALVNNDVALEAGWHEEISRALRGRSGVGGAATCLLDAKDPSRVQTAGIDWSEDGWARDHLSGEAAPSPASDVTPVFGASAAAALFRREMFDSAGLFDESLFAYQEDVDLALRARSRGWSFLLAPAARGLHIGQASDRPFPLGGTWADFYNARNRIAVLTKSLTIARWPSAMRRQAGAMVRSWPEGRGGAVLAGVAHGLLRLPHSLWSRYRGLGGRAPSRGELTLTL